MELRKVTAIIRYSVLESVEASVRALGISGLTTTHVRGYGQAKSLFFSRSSKVGHARVEIFLEKDRAEEVARAIMDAAHTACPGDGLVAIVPVERIWRIRTKCEATPTDLR